jgi:hypothetical protein
VILRALNFVVMAILVLAAAYVYRIKFEATVQAEHLAKLRDEVRHERDVIAALRGQWGELDNPGRIQELAQRFLKLKPIDPTQFDALDHLPDQPPDYMRPGSKDPIGGVIEHLAEPATITGSITPTSTALPPADGSGATPSPVPSVPPPPTTAPAQPGTASP